MIRHLVMPNNTGGSEEIMEWIAENLPKDTMSILWHSITRL